LDCIQFKDITVARSLITLIGLALLSFGVNAAVRPITDLPLQADGPDRWRLPAGEYRGAFRIDQPLQLTCAPGAVFQAEGQGNGLLIGAPDVSVEGCTFLDWGRDLTAMNAGIFIQADAQRAKVRGNRLQGPGFGIWVDGTADVSLLDNRIQGDPSIRSQDRGNGIHLYAVHGARVIDNQVRETRDGIYIDTSNGNLLQGNTLQDLRYGIHYMFSNDNRVLGNTTRRTRTGYALMQSRQLTVTGNRIDGMPNTRTSPWWPPLQKP
jgi:nitrous oxidase accessory protein